MAKTNKLEKFNTREDETYPNPDDLLVYQAVFVEEVSKNPKQINVHDSFAMGVTETSHDEIEMPVPSSSAGDLKVDESQQEA